MAPTSAAPIITSASPSLWSRFSKFVSENKTLVYSVSAATFVIVTGAGVYYVAYGNKKPFGSPATGESKSTELSKSDKKRAAKKEKRKQKKERERQEGKQHVLISAIKIRISEEPVAANDGLPNISSEVLSTLSPEIKKEYSLEYKNAGNEAFKKKEYTKALDLYAQAISAYADPIYYGNRAACYNALEQWDKVIEESTTALSLDPQYSKVLTRRAAAYEKIGDLPEAILDYTSVCLMSPPSDGVSSTIDELIKKHSEAIANDIFKTRKKVLASAYFITSYLASFTSVEVPAEVKLAAEGTGDYYLNKGLESLENKTAEAYQEAEELFEKAISNNAEHLALAYLWKATFDYLKTDNESAVESLEKSIELNPTAQAYIKLATLNVELDKPDVASSLFEAAVKADPNLPDIYYHRGQINFIMTQFTEAAKDFQKAIDLNNNWALAHIQLAVTQYKMGSASSAMAGFTRCLKKFPDNPDVYNYYGELLLDQQKYDEALEKFDQAFNVAKKSDSPVNVIPLINKATVYFQFQPGSLDEAEKIAKQAVVLDPESDFAIAILSQILINRNKFEEALTYFEKHVELARSLPELVQAVMYLEAAKIQRRLWARYPEIASQMQAAALAAAAGQI
ncbi:mitochondrial precursor protein [Lipomyces japonicus]|uniref:mitochondrial precursor protein n=1 Tax=Lipomyces japonicus TaxID=56871 RepID=UPI0034CEE2B6